MMDRDKLFYDVVSKFQPEDIITINKYDDGEIGMSLCILKDTLGKIEDSLCELLDAYGLPEEQEELYNKIKTTLVPDK